MTKHTPTPWELSADVRGAMWIYACGRPGTLVTQSIYGRTIEESDANAALIVRAVNAHDDLVAALRAMVNAYADQCADEDQPSMVRQARAALAKATGDA